MQIGKYQLIQKLATGGMAEVFLAKAAGPMGFEKLLVLKRILPHLATEPTFVEMFLTEARLAAQLNHPNIVQIFDFGEADGTYFLAMEYIDGPNLREIIHRSSELGLALPFALCARIVSSACEGLDFAHDFQDPLSRRPMNIVHRDISPDNILLSRQGAVKVVDFGIAKASGLSFHTQTGILKGKLAYMSPEQLRNETLDRRADVYALGTVFYELLTGFKPFTTTSEAGTLQAILFESYVPVLQHRSDTPEAIQRILAKALAKERERRYPGCTAFQAELEEFILSTAKPMGASQIAQIVSVMTNSGENPSPRSQPLHSAHSNPAYVSAQLQLPLEPLAVGSERPPIKGPRTKAWWPQETRESKDGELTPIARPSRLIRKEDGRAPPASSSGAESPQVGEVRSPERDMAWVALVGILLFLIGGGYLITRIHFWPRADLASPVPVAGTALPVPGPASQEAFPANEPEPGPDLPGAAGPGNRPPASSDAVPKADVPSGHSASRTGHAEDKHRSVKARAILGTLDLRVEPEAMLFLNGWQMGKTRRKPLVLKAGRYSLRLVNDELGREVRKQVTVTAGQTTRVEVNLRR